MKKKILSGLFALALLVATGYGVSKTMQSEADLSDLALANVEALAQNESGGDLFCNYYCSWWPSTTCYVESSIGYHFCFEKYHKIM